MYLKAGDSFYINQPVDIVALRTDTNTRNYMSAFYGDDSIECMFRYDNAISACLYYKLTILGKRGDTYYGSGPNAVRSKEIVGTDLANYKASEISPDLAVLREDAMADAQKIMD